MTAVFVMTSKGRLSDCELLKLMLAGSEDALSTLYCRRKDDIYRFVMQMTGSPEISEDLTQEVFMVLIRNGTTFDENRGSVNSFLLGIARNLVRQRISRERLFVSLNIEDEDVAVAEENHNLFDFTDDLARHEVIESVQRAVLSLPTRYREVIVLCELQEMSYLEAANTLNCAVGTVRSRLHRARTLLLKKLQSSSEVNALRATVRSARCVV